MSVAVALAIPIPLLLLAIGVYQHVECQSISIVVHLGSMVADNYIWMIVLGGEGSK